MPSTRNRRYRSRASRGLAHARRVRWLEWRSQQHVQIPADRLWLLHRFTELLSKQAGCFGRQIPTKGIANHPQIGRQRDIFPHSQLSSSECKLGNWSTQRWGLFRGFVNAVIGALNRCYGGKSQSGNITCRTAAHMDVLHRIVERCVDFHDRLQAPEDGSWESLVPDWVLLRHRPEGPKYGDLCADKVDVLQHAGVCDPVECLPPSVQTIIQDDKAMFANASSGLSEFENVNPADRAEYIKLVVRQLRAKQLGLAVHALGGGKVVAVGKPGGKRQRAVWNGRRVSLAASRPPKPRHLASPTALAHLECKPGKQIRCSKRDATCWFDQLRIPSELQRWMGRPSVSCDELYLAGMTWEEIQDCRLPGEPEGVSSFYPVSLTWPMGFAWSSYIAQEFLLDICKAADLDESRILSCDAPTPASFDAVFSAATDDVMIFSDEGAGRTSGLASKLDAEFCRRGVVRNEAKDVDDQLDATCVGVALESGRYLAVPPARCLAMFVGVLWLMACKYASPRQVHQQLGTQQWFDLLCRCKLSVYDKVYSFVRNPSDTLPRNIPSPVLVELAVGILLGVFWRLDLQRPFLPLLSATDACTEFGFGASVARLPEGMVRRLARISEKQGGYVVLNGSPSSRESHGSWGRAHRLGVSLSDFVDIFSVRKRFEAHINVLEGEAFLIWLRWLLRSRSRHCKRVVVLVDSAVWLGAAAKGRSSTQLNRLLRKAAAMELAGELQVYLVLVPSAENASDKPSRGVRRRKTPEHCCTAPPPSPY